MTYPLYAEFAHQWPMLAPLESYEEEMVEWIGLLENEVDEVLDLGTGGGHHLYHLFHQLPKLQSGLAVDLSQPMLDRVKPLIPQVDTLQHDMTSLRLERRFQLITVHDSFCYLQQAEQVCALFETIALHLESGGQAFVKVDAVKDSFDGPYRYLTNFEEDNFDLTLTHYEWDPNPDDTTLQVYYHFIESREGQLTTREETHTLGLFAKADLLEMAKEKGLNGEWVRLEQWDEDRENLLLMLKLNSSEI